MESSIKQKLEQYLQVNKELSEMRKQQKEHKKTIDLLEKDIQDYMTQNNLDSISTSTGEIILYEKKTSQTFKKDTMVEKLTHELKDPLVAEKIVDSIISNKVFVTQPKIRAKLKQRSH